MQKTFLLTALILAFLSHSALAQNEIIRERSSLLGIAELGVVVNVEKPIGLQSEALATTSIRDSIERELQGLPVSILSDRTLRDSDRFPILHIHINVMKAANNTYPFSIEVNFYQPVKLVLNRDMQTMAATWNKGQVGIVSADMFHVIAREAVYTAGLFKSDFEMVN